MTNRRAGAIAMLPLPRADLLLVSNNLREFGKGRRLG